MNEFYVKANTAIPSWVGAKFLQYQGTMVQYPHIYDSGFPAVFRNSAGEGVIAQIHGQVVVPGDYSIDQAVDFAALLHDEQNFGASGISDAASTMYHGFDFGSQDLQRSYDSGTGMPFVGAFTPGASFHLGLARLIHLESSIGVFGAASRLRSALRRGADGAFVGRIFQRLEVAGMGSTGHSAPELTARRRRSEVPSA